MPDTNLPQNPAPVANPVPPQPPQTPINQAAAPVPLQPYVQPQAMVDGQAIQPIQVDNSGQFGQITGQKPSKWRYFFIVLGIIQALGVGLFLLTIMWAAQQSKAGVSGMEFVGLLLLVTVVPAVAITAVINLIGLPIFMAKQKPKGKGLVLCIISLLISALLALYGAYTLYELRVALPNKMNELSEQSRQKSAKAQQQFAADNAKPEITKDEAIALLRSCQLKGFYYTNQTSPKSDGNWAELSTTGVVLTKIDGQPYRISIADRLVPELVPIAREAQKTCGGPQFWHDGHYE